MWSSLSKLAALPTDTRVYCGHEYTLSNGKFALALEPNNGALKKRMAEVERLRAENQPTIPSTIGLERDTNPFLRPESKELRKSLGLETADTVAVFAQGPIGLCATVGAKLMGATTLIAVETVPERIAVAKQLGADHVVDFRKANPVDEIRRINSLRSGWPGTIAASSDLPPLSAASR